jgi:hypothetical protein
VGLRQGEGAWRIRRSARFLLGADPVMWASVERAVVVDPRLGVEENLSSKGIWSRLGICLVVPTSAQG